MIGYFFVRNPQVDVRDFMHMTVPLMEAEAPGKILVDLKGFRDWEGYLTALIREVSAQFGAVTVTTGSNQLVAKAAFLAWEDQELSDLYRPWLTPWGMYIPQGAEQEFLRRAPVELLWPLAPEVLKRLKTLGFKRVEQVRSLPMAVLESQFGGQGLLVSQVSRGVYPYPLKRWEPEVQWSLTELLENPQSEVQVIVVLDKLIQQLSKRLEERAKGCRQLTLRLHWGGELVVATTQFSRGVWQESGLQTASRKMFEQLYQEEKGSWSELTRVEITAQQLQTTDFKQIELFALPTATNVAVEQKEQSLQKVLRAVQHKYQRSLHWGKELTVSRREQVLLNWDPLRFVK